MPGRNVNELAETLRALKIDENWIHEIVRRQVLANGGAFTKRTFEQPEEVRKELLGLVGTYLPADQVEKHSRPAIAPGANASPSCRTATSSKA